MRAKFSCSTDDPSAHQIERPAAGDDDDDGVAKDDLRRMSPSAVLQEKGGRLCHSLTAPHGGL